MAGQELTLNFQNNTNAVVPMSILANPSNLADISNQTTQYIYDLTSFNFATENTVSIEYRRVGATTYSVFTADLVDFTYQGIADALNGLGIGSFFISTSGLNTYLENYINDYEFNELDVFAVVPTYLPLQWFNQTIPPPAPSGSLIINVNAANIVNTANGVPASGTISNLIVNGDSIYVQGDVDPLSPPTPLLVYGVANLVNTLIHGSVVPSGGSGSYTFTADLNTYDSYKVLWG